MHRNFCFRRKQHSNAACDAALTANIYIESLEESLLNTVDAKNFKDFFQIF